MTDWCVDNTSLFTTSLAVKSSKLRRRGKALPFLRWERCAFSVSRAARLTGPPDPPIWVRTDLEDDTVRTAFAPAGQDALPAKPRGGYRIITAAILAAAWWAYRCKLIRLVDLRVWFAAHEMDARRCRIEPDLPCRFTLGELQQPHRAIPQAAQKLHSDGSRPYAS